MYCSGFNPLGRHHPHAAMGMSMGNRRYSAVLVADDHDAPFACMAIEAAA